MASFNKARGISVVSPIGAAEWCKYVTPDRKYNTKGELSTSLVLDPNDKAVKAFIKKLEDLRQLAYDEYTEELGAKGKQWTQTNFYQPHYDADGNETGNIVVKMKLKDVDDKEAQGKQYKITVKDSSLKDISNSGILVGNGSEIRLKGFAYPYPNPSLKQIGITMLWQQMQIVKLVAYGDGGDDFDAVDGFESEDDFVSETNNEADELDF